MAKTIPVSDETFGIIVRPLLTERSTIQKEKFNQYAFEVARTADKGSIRRAVQALFKVDVVTVRTMVVPGNSAATEAAAAFVPTGRRPS